MTPPSDAQIILEYYGAARPRRETLARKYNVSPWTIRTWVSNARRRRIDAGTRSPPMPRGPSRKEALPEDTTLRKCLLCGEPHASTGPGDRFHVDCRTLARNWDVGTTILW